MMRILEPQHTATIGGVAKVEHEVGMGWNVPIFDHDLVADFIAILLVEIKKQGPQCVHPYELQHMDFWQSRDVVVHGCLHYIRSFGE